MFYDNLDRNDELLYICKIIQKPRE